MQVANLGRRDTLEAVLPLLNRFLKGQEDLAGQLGEEGPVEVLDASTWGPMLAVRALFAELGLWTIVEECDADRPPHLRTSDEEYDDWIRRVPVLVANRLTWPAGRSPNTRSAATGKCPLRGYSRCGFQIPLGMPNPLGPAAGLLAGVTGSGVSACLAAAPVSRHNQ